MKNKVFITHETLQVILQGFFSNIKGKSLIYYDFFWNLYKTGLRCSELKDFSLWEIHDGGNIVINTLKGGAPREHMESYLSLYCISQFTGGNPCYSRLAPSTLCYWLETFLPHKNIFHETKSLKTHLFRHALAKELKYNGQTDEQIAIFFGEKDINNMKNYINSELYYWD